MKSCWPLCLLACQKDLNIEVILISESVNSKIRIASNNVFAELILISEFLNSTLYFYPRGEHNVHVVII